MLLGHTGAMTYKVNKMPETGTNFYFIFDFTARPSTWDRISGRVPSTFGVMEGCVLRLKKPFSLHFTLKVTGDSAMSKRYGRGRRSWTGELLRERGKKLPKTKTMRARKVFQTVFWLTIIKVFLMTTCFRMDTLQPHYNDDFMHFLLVNEFFVMEWIEQIYLNINHQSRLYIIQRVFQVCIIHSYRRSRSSVEVRYSSEAW